MLQTVTFLAERDQAEVPVLCRHIHFYTVFYDRFRFQAIGDQVFDADDLDVEFLGYLYQFRQACHRPVFIDDFDQCTGGIQPGQARQVYRSFRMPGTAKYATRTCTKRVDMSRTSQIGRFCFRIGQCEDCLRTVEHGNACRAAASQFSAG